MREFVDISGRPAYDDAWMSEIYDQAVDATLRHLRDLKSRGVTFLSLSPETSRMLKAHPPASGKVQTSAPAALPSSRPPSPAPPSPGKPAPGARLESTPDLSSLPMSSSSMCLQPGLTPEARRAALDALREKTRICRKCPHLADSRKTVVFGVGNPEAEMLFVGEAPGADEDEQGEPFVGKAGQLLTRIIQTMGLQRSEVYIANILKCRPDTPGQSAGNRKPTGEEMQTCLPYLQEQIDLIQPKVLIALGATAVEGLLGKTAGITRLRGNWQVYRGIPLMPTYHPAYLLRNQALGEKRKVWEDMLQVMEKLSMPVSEKQRGFFLKATPS